jgi:hypothetical protein
MLGTAASLFLASPEQGSDLRFHSAQSCAVHAERLGACDCPRTRSLLHGMRGPAAAVCVGARSAACLAHGCLPSVLPILKR